MKVNYKSREMQLYLHIVPQGQGKQILFGREWIWCLNFDLVKMNTLQEPQETSAKVQEILRKYELVFREGLEKLNEVKATSVVPGDYAPKFFKETNVPYPLHEKVEAELDKLEQSGIISKLDFS